MGPLDINWERELLRAQVRAHEQGKEPHAAMDMDTSERAWSAPFEIKAEDVTPDSRFTGYAAVCGNLDGNGDVIVPGAFAATLDAARRLLHKLTRTWSSSRASKPTWTTADHQWIRWPTCAPPVMTSCGQWPC